MELRTCIILLSFSTHICLLRSQSIEMTNSVRDRLRKHNQSAVENPLSGASTSFAIDYQHHQFLLDGKPFRYISGTLHYYRIHPDLWHDRLRKVKAAGLNAIQTYIPWNWHETFKGQYEFTGQKNVIRYLKMAHNLGLYVLVQVGPYTCAEIENGALPWWLIKTKDIRMRTTDPRFLTEVRTWYSVLLPKLLPLLRKNGGPILMVQPENEYSLFGCDLGYRIWLRDEIRRHFGNDTQQYTIDPPNNDSMPCGIIPDVFPTADFWPGTPEQMDKSIAVQQYYAKGGPIVNSEFYTGWFNMWGGKQHQSVPAKTLVDAMKHLWSRGASINMYAVHGGTIPAFYTGANAEPAASITTSYDFAAPIDEAGDCNEKYVAIRDWIATIPNWSPKPAPAIPKIRKKIAYGDVRMHRLWPRLETLLNFLHMSCRRSTYPLTFEDIDFPYGYVLYTTVLQFGGFNLSVPGIRDHGYVVLDKTGKGTLVSAFYDFKRHWLPLNATTGQNLHILVENQGRQHFETINDFKGIIENVTLDGRILTNWSHCGVNLPRLYDAVKTPSKLRKMQQLDEGQQNSFFNVTDFVPGFYVGFFSAEQLADTFFDPTGWGKGQLIVNGVNMGRYWPTVGPQITLFVPKPVIRQLNTVLLLELEQDGNCERRTNLSSRERICGTRFIDHSIFNYTTHFDRPSTDRWRSLAFQA